MIPARIRSAFASLLAAVLTGALLTSASVAEADEPAGLEGGATRLEGEAWQQQGRRVYDGRCYFCHGYSGDARTVAATFLEPPPRDFTALAPGDLDRDAMIRAVRDGRPGTAMQGFGSLLAGEDVAAVVDFIRSAFMGRGARAAGYHSRANGWSGDSLGSPAAPFVTGTLPQDSPWESLSSEQRRGKVLFENACVVCHARGDREARAPAWRAEALSNDHAGGAALALAHDDEYSRPPFGLHDRPPAVDGLSARAREGEALYQANCAFCHAPDGSGRNWIGSFLEPPPPDFTRPGALADRSPAQLDEALRRGVPGTSMPAWGTVLTAAERRAVLGYLTSAFPAFLPR